MSSEPTAPALRFSMHARLRMAERDLGEEDVRITIASPASTYGPTKRARIEHYGRISDGRTITVVTNAERTVVITVIDDSKELP